MEKNYKFEKSSVFLNNLVSSFIDNNESFVEEWCFGSGSLMEVCFKKNINYIGYDKSIEMWRGAKTRLNGLIK
jgi:hypothetical protein